MASVTKGPKSQYWVACYTDGDGRQLKRSTKTADRNEALRIALEIEGVEQRARRPGMVTGNFRKIVDEVAQKVTGESISVPTTVAYLQDWLNSARLRIAGPTFARYEGTVEQFLLTLGSRGTHPVTSITPKEIEDFMNARLRTGLAPKTVIVDLKTLSTAFRRAEAYSIIPKNPVDAVRKPKEVSSEREVFSLEEVQKLLDAAPDREWQTLILFGFFVGARLADCAHMKWDNVDTEKGAIIYVQRKTGKRVCVPMHLHVLEHLTAISRFGTKGHLCPSLLAKVPGGRNGLSGMFRKIMDKAGLDAGVSEGKGIRKFSARSFHSLRHSFSSILANQGVAEELRMRLTGHSSSEVHKKYTHLQMDPLKRAVASIPTFSKPEN